MISISDDGTIFGVRRMSSGGTYDKSFVGTKDDMSDIGSLIGSDETALMAVSANGHSAIGNASFNGAQTHAFWWSKDTGIKDIGTLGGSSSYAKGVSADGNIVVGDSYIAGDSMTNVFRWTLESGLTNIGTLGGLSTFSNAVSADGSTIVGYSDLENFETRAFRWTASAGIVSLNTLGGSNSVARGVSADGSVVVGASDTADYQQHAFRWTAETGMVDINPIGSTHQSVADLVSRDGKVVVGTMSFDNGSNQAFRWTSETGMISLSSLGSGLSNALNMTDDGSAVVGYSHTDTMAMRAFRWTAGDGMIDLGTIGGNNAIAYDISSDGTVIAGTAQTVHGEFHATLWKFPKPDNGANPGTDPGTEPGTNPGENPDPNPGSGSGTDPETDPGTDPGTNPTYPGTDPGTEPGTNPGENPDPNPGNGSGTDPEINPGENPGTDPGNGSGSGSTETPPQTGPGVKPVVIDVDHTVRTVYGTAFDRFSAMEEQRLTLGKLQKYCDVSTAGQTCYALFTDFSGFGDQKDLLSGFTLGHGFTENFSAGFTLAHSFWQHLPDGFDTGSDNFGGGAYAQWKDKTATGDWYMRASFAVNRYDTDVTRPVLAYTEAGNGESRFQGWGTTVELGRTDNLSFRNSRFGYYGGLRYSHISMDGYTESNALFPFTYSDMKYKLTTAYVGANYSMPLSDRFQWSSNIEIEQDLAHQDPEFNARADYIGGLMFDSDFAHTRGSASTSLSYRFSDQAHVALMPYFIRTASRENAFGALIRLSGQF